MDEEFKKDKEEVQKVAARNKDMSLLVNKTYNIKGVELDINDMMAVKDHYRRAMVQEYVFQNAKDDISTEDALTIADKAIEIMEYSHYCEDDAINIAREQLGFAKAFFN